jgi:hypothetical protein
MRCVIVPPPWKGSGSPPPPGARLRIARDVHDLVGHALSGIAVQSSTARLALDAGRSGAARTALSAVESASRAALTEMRQLLGGLRAGDTGEYGPVPGLRDLPGLVDGLRTQGAAVALSVGELGEVPDDVSLAVYRVVQEALTNVLGSNIRSWRWPACSRRGGQPVMQQSGTRESGRRGLVFGGSGTRRG